MEILLVGPPEEGVSVSAYAFGMLELAWKAASRLPAGPTAVRREAIW